MGLSKIRTISVKRGVMSDWRPRVRWFRSRPVHHFTVVIGVVLCLLPLIGDGTSPSIAAELAGSAHDNVGPSGAFQTAVPIELPSYRGLEPALALAYSSQGGDGWLGVGWDLTGLSRIQRASPGRGAPSFDASDVYYLDGMELIPCKTGMQSPSCLYPSSTNVVPYATRIEGDRRIEFDPTPAGGEWHVWGKTGIKLTYARGTFSANLGAFDWDLASVEDTLGNKVTYRYSLSDPGSTFENYLSAIAYNGIEVRFLLEQRPDVGTYATGYNLITVRHRLKTIDVTVGGERVRAYKLTYDTRAASTGRSFLASVQQYGRDATLDASGTVTGGAALPPITFGAQTSPGGEVGAWEGRLAPNDATWGPPWPDAGGAPPNYNSDTNIPWNHQWKWQSWFPGDFDADGRQDFVGVFLVKPDFQNVRWFVLRSALANQQSAGTAGYRYVEDWTPWTWPHAPSLDFFRAFTGDVNGDARSDVMMVVQGSGQSTGKLWLRTAISKGDGTFEFPQPPQEIPTHWDPRHRWFPGDANGDGKTDLMVATRNNLCDPACGCGTGSTFEHADLRVGLSRGDGTYDFRLQKTCWGFAVGDDAHWFVGDTDGDGMSDFQRVVNHEADASSSSRHAAFQTAISNGDGTFRLIDVDSQIAWASYLFPIPYIDQPLGTDLVQEGDFNGDGKTDLLLMKTVVPFPRVPARIVMWTAFSRGDGTFDFRSHDTVTLSPQHLNYWWSVHLNRPHFPNRWLTGDFDGDGATDVMIATPQFFDASIWPTRVKLKQLISKRDGHFSPVTEIQTNWWHECYERDPANPTCPTNLMFHSFAGDVNGDGRDDFMYAGFRPDPERGPPFTDLRVEVSKRNGLDAFRWTPADVNGDGRPDLVYPFNANPGIRVYTLLQNADGSYATKYQDVLRSMTHPVARDWRVMDVGGPGGAPDGRADLVHVAYHDQGGTTRGIRIYTLLANGDGTWSETSQDVWPGFGVRDTANWRQADVDGDGRVDLVHVYYLNPGIRIHTLRSNGNGTWAGSSQDFRIDFTHSDTKSWMPTDINGDGKADLVHLVKLVGGLTVRTLRSTGDGTWVPVAHVAWPSHRWVPWLDAPDTRSWRVMDANGDGKLDLVHVRYLRPGATGTGGIRVHTLLSNGNGTWARRLHDPLPSFARSDTRNWRSVDVNRDGRSDLVHVDTAGTGVRVRTLMSTRDGEWADRTPKPDAWPGFASPDPVHWRSVDADGDGKTDLLRVDIDGARLRIASLRAMAPLDLMTTRATGLGGETTVEYRPSSRFPSNDPAQSCFLPTGAILQVVAGLTTSDGRSGVRGTETYAYACPRWSYAQRGFLGWHRVSADRPPAANHPRSGTVTRYSITEDCLARPQEVQLTDGAGGLVSKVTTEYKPPGRFAPFQCRVHSHVASEGNLTAVLRSVRTIYNYDAFGNVTGVHEVGNLATVSDDRGTTITYNPATGPYLVGLPSQVRISEARPGGRMYRTTSFCYDGDNGSETVNCSGKPSMGLLTATKALDDLGRYVTTGYAYDANGNPVSITDARGNASTVSYDPTFHLYPTTTCNALGHCEELSWDMTIGEVIKATDANGQSTGFAYDALGRTIGVTLPNGGMQTTAYLDWGDPRKQRVRETASDGSPDDLWSETSFDGLGRVYQIVREGDAPERTFIQQTLYADASSQVHQQSLWFPSDADPAAVPAYEEFEYDAAGRLERQIHPDGAQLRWTYGNDVSRTWVLAYDERGTERGVYEDAFGRVTESREPNGGQPSSTRYTYNVVDELLTATDAAGNVTTNTWDLLGRQTRVSDPDLGTWTYTYDPVGNLATQTDANGATTTFTYDALSRMTRKEHAGGTAAWRYDEAEHGASRGRLTSVSDPSGAGCPGGLSESLQYDAMGQITSQRKCVTGRAFTLGFGYDALGRATRINYPDGEVVTYAYDSAGRLSSMPRYVDQILYDADDRPREVKYANGTVNAFTYDRERRWLEQATVTQATRTLYEASYQHEPNGLVAATSSSTNKMNLTFAYDDLNRLTTVSGDWQQSLSYDALGNITSNSAVGAYAYPPSGPTGCTQGSDPVPCERPHAVASAGTRQYQYDRNGNMISVVNSETRKQRTINWSLDNQPVRIADFDGRVTNMVYDAWGARVAKSRGDRTTRYLGPLLEHSAGGLTKYYYAGSTLVARKNASGTFWYHQDQLGSTRLMTNRDGGVAVRYDYTPFGQTSSSSGRASTDIKFTGHRTDEANDLIYMNARYYDPRLGRFLSADPIGFDGVNPQSLNSYAYALNNPISNTDPTGLQSETDPLEVNDPVIEVGFGAETPELRPFESLAEYAPPMSDDLYAEVQGPTEVPPPEPPKPPEPGPALTDWQDWDLSGLANFSAGFGDTLSFGLTSVVRGWMGTNQFVDKASGGYSAGEWSGTGLSLAFGGAHLGRNAAYQGVKRLGWDPRTWGRVRDVWSQTAGGGTRVLKARGQSLHHWLFPQRWGVDRGGWVPRGIINAGFNYLPIGAGRNSWMGSTALRRVFAEGTFRVIVSGIYGAPVTAYLNDP